MSYQTNGVTILEGLEPIRRRPTMYIGAGIPEGASLCGRLLEVAVDCVATDRPVPSEIRLTRWRDGAFTVARDGEPLPIEPVELLSGAVPHPALYGLFLYLFDAEQRLGFSGAILNALSERLVVSTVHGAERYRAVFAKGVVVSLLRKESCETPLATNWMTFLPDCALLGHAVDAAEAEQILVRIGRTFPSLSF